MITIDSVARQTVSPPGPGGFLRHILQKAQVTQEDLAGAMSTSRFTISQIITGRRSVTPSMALKLSRATGTSIDVWLNLQRDIDLWEAYRELGPELERVEVVFQTMASIINLPDTELERFAEALFSEQFSSIDEAAVVAKNATTNQLPGYVVALSLDNVDTVSGVMGLELSKEMITRFAEDIAAAADRLGATVYHFSYETLVLILQADDANPVLRLTEAFAEVPAIRDFGKFKDMRVTITGGVAPLVSGERPYEQALQAVDLMDRLSWLRSSERVHMWSAGD